MGFDFRRPLGSRCSMREIGMLLRLKLPGGAVFGPGKALLLEHIQTQGSISAAGRQMGMSYKRAWSLVEEMNGSFAEPLVESSRGGASGGGAKVTVLGAKVLAHFRAIEAQTLALPEMADLEGWLLDMSVGK